MTDRDYSLLGSSAAAAVESGLAQADWYRTPVPRKRMKELMQRSDRRAVIDTIVYLVVMIGTGALGVVWWFSWRSLVAFFVYGVLYGSAGDSRWHEAGHGTAFKTRWMNDAVYQIACFTMMRQPTVWKWSHTRHHTDTIIVGRDPEIVGPRPLKMWKIVANYVGLIDVYLALRALPRYVMGRVSEEEAVFIPQTEWKKVAFVSRIWLVIYVATVAVAIGSRSILPLMVIGLPRLYGCWHMVLTGLTQHAGLADNVTDHRLNCRSTRLNPISRFVYWNMNYHVEHHMFPMVPYYRLPQLHDEIAADLPPISPSLWAAYKEFVPVLWAQRHDADALVDRRPVVAGIEARKATQRLP